MLDVAQTDLGPLTLVRNLRAFRVFRLFKRIKALRKILEAITRSVAGVSSAMVVITIVMSIYAILGVAFFKDLGADGSIRIQYSTRILKPPVGGCAKALLTFPLMPRGRYGSYSLDESGNLTSGSDWHVHDIDGYSARGIPFGEEYFGNFGRALYTCFQLLLGDSWSEVVGKQLIWGEHEYGPVIGVLYMVRAHGSPRGRTCVPALNHPMHDRLGPQPFTRRPSEWRAASS